MKNTVSFYLGDKLLYQREDNVEPAEGAMVRLFGKSYIAAKVHYLYESTSDTPNIGVALSEIPRDWLPKVYDESLFRTLVRVRDALTGLAQANNYLSADRVQKLWTVVDEAIEAKKKEYGE